MDDTIKNLQDLPRDELNIVARKLKIRGYRRLCKPDLIGELEKQPESNLRKHLKISWWDKYYKHVYGVGGLIGLIITIAYVVVIPLLTPAPENLVELLEQELRAPIENFHIETTEGLVLKYQRREPSERARELAEQIPDDADSYALALKAIAEKRFDDAREYLKQLEEAKEVELSKIYETLGLIEYYEARYVEAVRLYKKALNLEPDNSILLNNTVVALTYTGEYNEALPLCMKALKISEQTYGPDHPIVATVLNNLAVLYEFQGRYGEAEELNLRALEIREKAHGNNHSEYAQSLNNLAKLYWSQGRYREAEPLYKRALEIKEKRLGQNHPDYARSLNNLALLYQSQGRFKEVESLYKRALEIRKKALGDNHYDYAQSLNNLAGFYQSQGRYGEAEPLYKRALEILEKSLGPVHPNLWLVLENMVVLYHEMGNEEEARKYDKKAKEMEKKVEEMSKKADSGK